MEGSQRERELGGILLGDRRVESHNAADHSDKREEENKYPDDAKDIEKQVSKSCSPCLCVRT